MSYRGTLFVCYPGLDPAVLPSVRTQPGEAVVVCTGLQPGELLRRLCLPNAVKHWSLRSLEVKPIKIGGRALRDADTGESV